MLNLYPGRILDIKLILIKNAGISFLVPEWKDWKSKLKLLPKNKFIIQKNLPFIIVLALQWKHNFGARKMTAFLKYFSPDYVFLDITDERTH